jgi:hypothetical protein
MGILIAVVNDVFVMKIIRSCPLEIIGPETICSDPVVYTLPPIANNATSWEVTPEWAFSVAYDQVSATVTALTTKQSGTLTATVDSITVTKEFTACGRAIFGPSTLCANGTYTLPGRGGTSWSVTPTSAFSVTSSNSTSAVVTPLGLSGQSGTLTATVFGAISIRKTITACSATISGPSTLCANGTYSLSAGSASSWSVTPTSAFSITSSDSTSAKVSALNLSGQSGTLKAIVNGVAIAKTITSCRLPISGPELIIGSSCGAFTYSLDSLPAGSHDFNWLFHGAHCMQVGLLPSGISQTLAPATVTFNENASSCAWLNLVFSFVTTVDGVDVTHLTSTRINVNSLVSVNTAVPTIYGVYNEYGEPVTSGLAGSSYTFKADTVAAEEYLWTYTSPNTSAEVTGFSPIVVFTSAGVYTISVQSFNGCEWSDPSESIEFTVYDLYIVYPNPVTDFLHFARNAYVPSFVNSSGSVQLISVASGALVVNNPCDLNYSFSIDMSLLSTGTYLLRLLDASGRLLQQKTIVKS